MGFISSTSSDVGFVGDAVDAVRDPEFAVRREGAEGDARPGARGVPQDGQARGDLDQYQVRRYRVELHDRQSPHQHRSLVEFCGRVAGARSRPSSRVRTRREGTGVKLHKLSVKEITTSFGVHS